ncbi:MAG: hypothetical protein HON70_40710 [Lentisphaerae bacterium]|nr:hypothetical protein [Lentisphaerota bacterium]
MLKSTGNSIPKMLTQFLLCAVIASVCRAAEPEVITVPEILSRHEGYFAEGRYGQALWHHSSAHARGYPVTFGATEATAGTISVWVRLARPRWTYEHQRLLTLTDGVQHIVLHVHSGHPKDTELSPRDLWITVDKTPGRPPRWFHANKRLPEGFHEQFHHVLFTWKGGESTTYLDGQRIGGKTDDKNWISPFRGTGMTLSLRSSGVWFDDVVLLRRYLNETEAGKVFDHGKTWVVDENTALHLPFNGSQEGQAATIPDGSGVAFACYTDTTDNHFLADDPVRLKMRLLNHGPAERALRLQVRIENLGKETVAVVDRELRLSPGEPVEKAIDLDLDQRGLFWAHLHLEDPNGGVVAEQSMAFAVTLGPDVAQYAASDIPNGMVVSQSSQAAPGQKWAGFEYLSGWRGLEHEPGKWDFSVLDMVVGESIQNGLEPHLMFYGTPDWQSTGDSPPAHFRRRRWSAPRDNDAWTDYVSRLTRRYKGKVRTYEVWNEPYWNDPSGGYFYGTAQRYAELVCLAADAVHAIDPKARVVSGFGGPSSWCEKVAQGTAGKADLYGTHPYSLATKFQKDENDLLKLRAVLKAAGASERLSNTEISDKQLWNLAVHADGRPMTAEEFDRQVKWDDVPAYYRKIGRHGFFDHFTSASMVVRSHAMSLAGGCEYVLWWTYNPNVTGTTFRHNTPSLQSVAYANFAGLIAGRRYVQRINLGASYLKAYLFAQGGGNTPLVVAWADKERETVHLEVGSDTIEALDISGNRWPLTKHGPLVSLQLAPSPVYLRGFETPPTASQPVLAARVTSTCVYPGGDATVDVSVYNPLHRPLEATVTLDLPAPFPDTVPWQIKLPARQTQQHEFTIPVPQSVAGSQTVTATLTTDTEELGRIARRTNLPVRLRALAPKAKQPPQIDGVLTEWGPVEQFPIRIDRAEQVVIGTPYTAVHDDPNLTCDWAGPTDVHLAAALSYDAENLYLAVRVWDNAVVNVRAEKQPPLSYEGDCIEIFLDGRKPEEQGRSAYADDVLHIMVVPPLAKFPAPMFHLSKPRHGKLKAVALDAERLGDGYALELRIPRSNLPSVSLDSGVAIGFDIAVDDSDDANVRGRKSQLVWAGDSSNSADAAVFGRLQFE